MYSIWEAMALIILTIIKNIALFVAGITILLSIQLFFYRVLKINLYKKIIKLLEI